ALLVATVIVVCFVLPAEFRIDPTGIGRRSGVIQLAGPKKLTAAEAAAVSTVPAVAGGAAARYYEGGYRSDFVDIPLKVAGTGEGGDELEYKVHMKPGATLAYSWSVAGLANPDEFYYDFHGEASAKTPGSEPTVVEYRQATGTQSHGTLVAPFDGIFGWYLQNQSEKPLVVRLKISGFYDLVPPGGYGNDMAIEANKALP
ncbi:MAG: hypothetical protein ABI885_19215, partial [Gammaproteobacteria bacterium]